MDVRSAPGEKRHHHRKDAALDGEGNKRRQDHGQRDDQTVEINFAEQADIAGERVVCLYKAGGEVVPGDGATHVEQNWRQTVGGEPDHSAEHEAIGQGGQDRVNDMPERAENGLLVDGDEVAPDKQPEEVAVLPEFG